VQRMIHSSPFRCVRRQQGRLPPVVDDPQRHLAGDVVTKRRAEGQQWRGGRVSAPPRPQKLAAERDACDDVARIARRKQQRQRDVPEGR
jgi:hypothetical protein